MARCDPVLSETFRLLTPASPEQVWGALTCPQTVPAYLCGLSPSTAWAPGAAVVWSAPPTGATLAGTVLHAAPPRRLSVTLEDSSGTCTYLTWTIRRCEPGTLVRLDAEECDGGRGDASDLEDVWLPVLDRLRAVLGRLTPSPGD